MRATTTLAAALLASWTMLALATDGVWRTPDGTLVQETESRKSIDGFGAWLVITPDPDWQRKWDTPSHVTPRFTEAKVVKQGGKVTILIFFANPKPDTHKRVNVRCDIQVKRPNGTFSVNQKDLGCMEGPLEGSPESVRLAAPVINFVGERGDPVGEWRVEVRLTDAVRGTSIPVRTSFKLE